MGGANRPRYPNFEWGESFVDARFLILGYPPKPVGFPNRIAAVSTFVFSVFERGSEPEEMVEGPRSVVWFLN